jgi:hypothetical protein
MREHRPTASASPGFTPVELTGRGACAGDGRSDFREAERRTLPSRLIPSAAMRRNTCGNR